jgi:hypothetical protein
MYKTRQRSNVKGQILAFASGLMLMASVAPAQTLPSGPLSFGDGRVTVAADLSLTASTPDDRGAWFNYTDYEHNVLRLIRFGVSASVRITDRVALLGEVRSENGNTFEPYAGYVRVRPWKNRAFDIQAGRIPPIFGAFARRAYAADHPLIGYPLAYQYLTALRPDAIPATADDLLRMRGRGWLTSYPLGQLTPDRGMPLVTAFRWDTGVEVRAGSGPLNVSAAVTNGTLSDPRARDNNGGKQISSRVEWRPAAGFIFGASGAHGAYLADSVKPFTVGRGPVPSRAGRQQAFGIDLEYSRDQWLARGEVIRSQWGVPTLSFSPSALGMFAEARYKIWPGLFVAGRVDRLTFSSVRSDDRTLTWDAPVSRFEGGLGFYLQRNLLIKGAYQRNWRDGGRVRDRGTGALQLQFWL